MPEKLSNRPIGAYDDDLGELNDYTIQDIATAEKTSPEDRENAEAEIATRIAAGTYDPDNAPHTSRSDLLSHGYGVENGKILYPKPEYKAWLKSDRSLKPPIGAYRETIEDRAEALRKANQSLGNTMLQVTLNDEPIPSDLDIPEPPQDEKLVNEEYDEYNTYEDSPSVEKFPHPSPATVKKRQHMQERRSRYENADHVQSAPSETIDSDSERVGLVEQAKERAKKLAYLYEHNFPKYASKWITRGVVHGLSHGALSTSDAVLIPKGFSDSEDETIASKIDPENTLPYYDLIGITGDLKRKVLYDALGEHEEEYEEEEERPKINIRELNPKEREVAIRRGITYAIEAGATVDPHTGKVSFALPTEKGDELLKYIEENGVNTDSTTVQFSAQKGFANIIEAIKDKDSLTEEGFRALDWYFDNFKFKQHLEKFEDIMDGYQEYADPAWRAKYVEYMEHRRSLDSSLEKAEKKPTPTLKEAEEMTEEELLAELVEAEEGAPDSPAVYLEKQHNYLGGHATGHPNKRNVPPSSLDKLRKLVSAYRTLKLIDSSITVYRVILAEKDGKEKNYRALRFGDSVGGNNVAVLIPIQEASSDASFVWVGQTGDNRDGWMEDFLPKEGDNAPASKGAIHANSRIHVHYHRASIKQNRSATENMWHNIYKDISKRTEIKIA